MPGSAGLDPHLAPVDDAMQAALVPEVRQVGAERAEPLGRESKERLGKADERHGPDATRAGPCRRPPAASRQFPQGSTFRQFATVSFTVCVPVAPYDSVSRRFAVSPHESSFSTNSQAPSTYLYSSCVDSLPVAVNLQWVSSTPRHDDACGVPLRQAAVQPVERSGDVDVLLDGLLHGCRDGHVEHDRHRAQLGVALPRQSPRSG